MRSRLRPAAVIVLAAGGGTRMKSATPKVLHTIGGRSLVGHALAAARGSAAGSTCAVVVGHGRDQVEPHIAEIAPEARRRRAGRAARHRTRGPSRAAPRCPSCRGTVVVTYGDVPLLTTETLQRLVDCARDATRTR